MFQGMYFSTLNGLGGIAYLHLKLHFDIHVQQHKVIVEPLESHFNLRMLNPELNF